MLVATPGQTTTYVLHSKSNSTSGNTTTSVNIPTASATAAASSPSATIVTTKKQQAVLNNSSSTKETTKCVNNNNNTSSATKSTQPTKTANSTTAHSNNFHVPSNKRDSNNIARNSLITTSSSSKNSNSQQLQHSLNNSGGISRPPSFLSALKDTVQKALVTTASTLSRNGGNRTTATTTLNSSNATSSSNNTTSTLSHATSSASSLSLPVATTKNSTTTITKTAASASSSSSTIIPLTVARKKFAQAIATQPKLHTIPPTILHRYPEERQKASSTDSLQKEMCHFKPIRTVPTTPWKSGSKSRGSSLRFPKANLATTNTEFILKSNCDVNIRKRKQHTKLKQNDQEILANDASGSGDNNDEQENKAYYEIYKPKPSSLHLSASFMTQNHQSAFVCLVANLMNIQSTNPVTTSSSPKLKGDNVGSQKPKSSRISERSKGSGSATAKVASPTVPVKELFVRHKKFKSPLPPPPLPAKRAKLSTSAIRSHRSSGKSTLAPNADIASAETMAKVTPSRRKLKGADWTTVNVEQMEKDQPLVSPAIDAEEKTRKTTVQRNSRKRKGNADDSEARTSIFTPLTGSLLSVPPTPISRSHTARARRSVRLTAETCSSNIYFKYPELSFSRAMLQQVPSQRNEICFSPPLTRSRLKRLLSEHQSQKAATTSVIDVKKRKDLRRQTTKSVMSSLEVAV